MHIFCSLSGDLHGSDSKSSRDRCSDHSSGLSTDCSQDLMRSSGSGLVNDLPCTSGSDIQVDSFHAETECSRSGSYPFISDVNSLAWGLCGESYDQHGDASFRELLFVSGRCGVTVHAFRKLSKSRGMDHAALEGHFGKGRWYDWGPQNMKVDKSCCLHHEFSAAQDVDGTGGDGEMHHNHCEVVGDAYGSSPTKKWLKSFFIGVETIACDGTAWTKFPESAECPSSVEVISFNIFNVNQPRDFCYKEKHAQNTENSLEDDSDHQRLHLCGADTASEVLSSLFGVEINRCYKCLKVFSSASYNLVGFIFTSTDLMSANTGGVDKREKKSLLLVARLDNRGIKWVSLVKPDERVNIELTIEWVDFQFSDNLLVCLNSSGFIVLYDAISGEFVTHLDVAQACGLDPHSDLRGLERFPLTSDVEVNQVYDKAKLSDPNSVPSRRSYKRLVVASHTSVLAVVDENGVIYVICLGDYMPKKNSLYEKLLPYYQQFGLGILFNWGVCGSDISHQMRNSNFSSFFRDNNSVGNVPQNIDDSTFQGTGDFNDSYSSGFSAASRVSDDRKHCTSGMESHIMRKIFLPNFRSSDDYSICFSPLGITCLSKKHNVNNKKSSELVHFNLLVKSAMYDDNYLNSGCNVYPLNGKEEIVIGEALGCAFQGSFYIVREDGLSVYLPSLSLTSNILPVEYNGYHQSNKNTWISRPVKGNVEMNEPVVRCSPWKIEILDRVLLYESTEEADRLCLENGECFQDALLFKSYQL